MSVDHLVSVLLTVRRGEALRLFKQSPFFAPWHPEVLRLYVDYGLTTDTGSSVKLKTTPLQESLTFADAHVSKDVGELLDKLDGSIILRWIIPAPR